MSAAVAHASVVPAPDARSVTVRLRLTRRGRIVFTTLAAIPLVVGALIFVLGGGIAVATGGAARVQFEYVTIHTGQSLWQLAERIAPEADPRDFIADIVSLNRLEADSVQPGQRLAIPTRYDALG